MKGILRSQIKDEWCTPMFILQKYLTCKGRYATISLYHLDLLLHLTSEQRINVLYLLLKSLQKMSKEVHRAAKNPREILYHYGLIKILIADKLGIRNDDWDDFLQRNQFITVIEEPSAQPLDELHEANKNLEENGIDAYLSSHP